MAGLVETLAQLFLNQVRSVTVNFPHSRLRTLWNHSIVETPPIVETRSARGDPTMSKPPQCGTPHMIVGTPPWRSSSTWKPFHSTTNGIMHPKQFRYLWKPLRTIRLLRLLQTHMWPTTTVVGIVNAEHRANCRVCVEGGWFDWGPGRVCLPAYKPITVYVPLSRRNAICTVYILSKLRHVRPVCDAMILP